MFRSDERAQSIGISKYLLSLIVAAILAWIVKRITSPVLSNAPDSNAKAAQATQWFQTGVDNLFLAFVVIAVLGLVALSVYQREVLG